MTGRRTRVSTAFLTAKQRVAQAKRMDPVRFERVRAACCEFSPIDLDEHAALVVLEVNGIHVPQAIDGPAAPALAGSATGPDRSNRT